ncbi:MAG: endonuclease NucS [Candidatus Ranarchaeia archaeon]|jgi:RecB family endonuclease NucS
MVDKNNNELPSIVLEHPSLLQGFEFLEEGILHSKMIILVAHCEIDYDGRARSFLPFGERVLMIKPDGSLLIHTSKKYTPVNWQPPGCTFSVDFTENIITLTSKRRHPLETVRISINNISFISKFILHDDEVISVYGSEADMVDMVQANPELIEKGFKIYKRERTIDTGEIDILGVDTQNNLVVIEAKRRQASHASVHQLQRYVESMKKKKPDQVIRGILLAPAITEQARKILHKYGLEFKRLIPNISRDFDEDKQTKLFR